MKMEYRHKYDPRRVLPSIVTVIMQRHAVASRVPVLSTMGLGRALNARLVWVDTRNNASLSVSQQQKALTTVGPPTLPPAMKAAGSSGRSALSRMIYWLAN